MNQHEAAKEINNKIGPFSQGKRFFLVGERGDSINLFTDRGLRRKLSELKGTYIGDALRVIRLTPSNDAAVLVEESHGETVDVCKFYFDAHEEPITPDGLRFARTRSGRRVLLNENDRVIAFEEINPYTILIQHAIPENRLRQFLLDQQQAADKFQANFGQYTTETKLISFPSGIFFIRKVLGKSWNLPINTLQELLHDYNTHVEQLRIAGVKILADNYNLEVVSTGETGFIEVDQLFFPYGTALDWVKNNKEVGKITKAVINNAILPLLDTDETISTPAWVDLALRNFSVIPTASEPQIVYFDFFPPRLKDAHGKIKRFGNIQLVPQGEDIGEYLGFTKSGIIHRFIRKNYLEIFDQEDKVVAQKAWESFCWTTQIYLEKHLTKYFPGLSVQTIAETDYLQKQFI